MASGPVCFGRIVSEGWDFSTPKMRGSRATSRRDPGEEGAVLLGPGVCLLPRPRGTESVRPKALPAQLGAGIRDDTGEETQLLVCSAQTPFILPQKSSFVAWLSTAVMLHHLSPPPNTHPSGPAEHCPLRGCGPAKDAFPKTLLCATQINQGSVVSTQWRCVQSR